jgi:hypothetical protein
MAGTKEDDPAKPRAARKQVSRARILRAVASSTALETGESVTTIEARLKSGRSRYRHLKLG